MPSLEDEKEQQTSPTNSPALQDRYSNRDLQDILDEYEKQRRKALEDAQLRVAQDQNIRNYIYENRDKINDDKLKAIMEINKAEHIAMHAKGNYSPIQFNKTNPTPLQIKDSEGNPLHTLNYMVSQGLLIADVPKQADKGYMHLSLALQDANGNNIAADKAVYFEVSYGVEGKLSSINHPEPLSFEGTPPNEKCKFKVEGVDYYLKVDKATLDGLHTQLSLNRSQDLKTQPLTRDVLVHNIVSTPPFQSTINTITLPQATVADFTTRDKPVHNIVSTPPSQSTISTTPLSQATVADFIIREVADIAPPPFASSTVGALPSSVIGETMERVIIAPSSAVMSSMARIEPRNAILTSISDEFDSPLNTESLTLAAKEVAVAITRILPVKKEVAIPPSQTITPVKETLSQPKPTPAKGINNPELELAKAQEKMRKRIESKDWTVPKYNNPKAPRESGSRAISLGNHTKGQLKSSADTPVDRNNHKQFTNFNPQEFSANTQSQSSKVLPGGSKINLKSPSGKGR